MKAGKGLSDLPNSKENKRKNKKEVLSKEKGKHLHELEEAICHTVLLGPSHSRTRFCFSCSFLLNALQLHLKEEQRSPKRGSCAFKRCTQKTSLLFCCCRTATIPNGGTRVVSCGSRSDLQRPKDAGTQIFQPSLHTSQVTSF